MSAPGDFLFLSVRRGGRPGGGGGPRPPRSRVCRVGPRTKSMIAVATRPATIFISGTTADINLCGAIVGTVEAGAFVDDVGVQMGARPKEMEAGADLLLRRIRAREMDEVALGEFFVVASFFASGRQHGRGDEHSGRRRRLLGENPSPDRPGTVAGPTVPDPS